jgi:hypothetical protein
MLLLDLMSRLTHLRVDYLNPNPLKHHEGVTTFIAYHRIQLTF